MSYLEKSSSSKPTATFQEVDSFVLANLDAAENSLEKLTEGHISQAFSFVDNNKQKLVIRIGKSISDFEKDQYAYSQLNSKTLPIPKVLSIGDFPGGLYYCVSVFVEGKASDMLSENEMKLSLKSQLESLASLFSSDVSSSIGWGPIDLKTNNGVFDTWHDLLIHKIQKLDKNVLRNSVTTIGLDANIIDRLYNQFESNLSVIDEPARRLTHGDPGFDNVLVRNDKVVAVIDWGALGYGDWLYDMARLDFWWLGRYGEFIEFANMHNLETEKLEQRTALYWAYFSLTTLEFAFTSESESTKNWLMNNIESKLI